MVWRWGKDEKVTKKNYDSYCKWLWLYSGGASKVAIDTAKILHENGYHVIFFSGTHSIEEFTENGYQNITLNLPECLKDKNKIRGAFRGLYNFKAKKE